MKRFLLLAAVLLLSVSLAACSGGQNPNSVGESSSRPESTASSAAESSSQTEGSSETSSSASGSSTQSSQEESSGEAPSETGENSGILVAYFSWSGNTERLAQMIQADTGGDLFEIAPATPYTDNYDELLDIAQQEQADNARPELASQVENWDSYTTVFVGYPDWWSDAPMAIYSFLESYDWEGKTLVPFCTSGGSGFGRSLDKLPDSAPGAAILEGLHVGSGSVDGAAEDVAAWLDGLGL